MTSRRTIEVVAIVLVITAASLATAILYSAAPPAGGKTSTSCSAGYCTVTVATTTTTTLTTSIPPSTVLPTTTATTTVPITTTATTTTTVVSSVGNASSMRLGFWLSEEDIIKATWQGGYDVGGSHPASLFFNTMFLTPPYPASLDIMVFAPVQDETAGSGCSTSDAQVGTSINFWSDLANSANAYPNIKLVIDIAFDPTNNGTGTYGLSCFNTMVQAFSKYSSVYGIGVEGEYTRPAADLTLAEMQTAQSDVQAVGKQFINYYVPPSLLPSGALEIPLVRFPGGDAGGYDQVGVLQYSIGSQGIGLASGYYATFPFPGSVTCPVASDAMNVTTSGWNQCVVNTEIDAAVGFSPASERQFLELCVGYAPSSFVGVSGQTTTQLWDNPSLRSWIWNNLNYAQEFVLSV